MSLVYPTLLPREWAGLSSPEVMSVLGGYRVLKLVAVLARACAGS